MEKHSCIIAAGNLLEAHTWKGLLESRGIEVEIKGEALLGGVGELPVEQHNVELWVAKSDYELAKAQLASLGTEGPQWQCVNCHEINDGSFELCWHCSAERSVTHN